MKFRTVSGRFYEACFPFTQAQILEAMRNDPLIWAEPLFSRPRLNSVSTERLLVNATTIEYMYDF